MWYFVLLFVFKIGGVSFLFSVPDYNSSLLGNHTKTLRHLVSSWNTCSQCNHLNCQGKKRQENKELLHERLSSVASLHLKSSELCTLGICHQQCAGFSTSNNSSQSLIHTLTGWSDGDNAWDSFPGDCIQKNVWILNKHSYRFINCCVAYLLLFELICSPALLCREVLDFMLLFISSENIHSVKDLGTLSPQGLASFNPSSQCSGTLWSLYLFPSDAGKNFFYDGWATHCYIHCRTPVEIILLLCSFHKTVVFGCP